MQATPPTIQLELHAPASATAAQNLERSFKRARKFTRKRLQNIHYSTQVKDCLKEFNSIGGEEYLALDKAGRNDRRLLKERLEQYYKNLCQCGGKSLYRRCINSPEATLITSLTCSHRLCNVCNMVRANKMRRKWSKFFRDSERNVPVRKAQRHMFENVPIEEKTLVKLVVDQETGEMTEERETNAFTSGADLLLNFEFMHLTLTVPHSSEGWNGKKYYAKELIAAFNLMRKTTWWLEMVFGGELSVETTRSLEGGLHIHMHALILVDKRIYRSRNKLYELILQKWNQVTVDTTRPISEKLINGTTDEGKARLEGVRKGMQGCGDDYFNNFMLEMDGRGSTMIGIKGLYYELPEGEAAKRKVKFTQNGKTYGYCNGRAPLSMVKGVMECLKYHFEPAVLEKEDGTLDTEFLKEVLPNIYRQRLYAKFGGFYGVKQLNVAEDPLTLTDMMEDLADNGQDEAFSPKTGLPMDRSEYLFGIADSRGVTFNVNGRHYTLERSKIRVLITDQGVSTGGAISFLAFWGHHGEGKKEAHVVHR